MSRAEYEACQTRDEASFRAAIEAITVKALQQGLSTIDYRAVVADEWRRGGLSEIIDKRVEIAIAEVRTESSWADLLRSLANKEKAQELATAVAERVYRSDAMKVAIEGLAVGVGKEVGKRIEIASLDAAEPAIACLNAYLGPRYGATVAGIVTGDASREFGIDPTKGEGTVTSGAVLREGAEGITGAAILMVRRQLATMASRIGQRLVGSVLSRLVSVVAGGVGVVLIAKDIWDLRHGVLPIIETEMKSKETKDKVQEELAKTIAEQIGEHVKEIGAKTAERVVEIWKDFRRAHAKALDLAEQNDAFRAFLDSVKPERLARLDEILALILAAEGEPAILRRLNDGTLNEAVNVLPAPGLDIARETRSLEAALQWSALAGDALPRIVELEIYRRAKPEDFTKASLQRILALDDRLAITRLASVSRETRDTLFDLDTTELKGLTKSLTERELTTLARYLTGLEKAPRERVLRAVALTPAKMQVLASERVREAVIASPDQTAAVAMMLRSDSYFDFVAISDDIALVAEGRVSPVLLWEKHPIVVGSGLVLALILLLMLRRLLFGRRGAVVPARH